MKKINDGDKLDNNDIEILQDLINDDNQIIKKYDKGLFFNFVGYISVEKNNVEHEYFSFPKQYIFDDEKKIIRTICNSFKDSEHDKDSYYLSKFEALKNIIYYYNEYGLYKKIEKTNQIRQSGKIDFKKTMKKVKPIYVNGYSIYDNFVVKKKESQNNLITECMSYIIETGTKQFSFYFNTIVTNHSYSTSMFTNKKYIINQLLIIKNTTFKDEEKKLIDNMIEYLGNHRLDNSVKSFICTTNYELVFETMVHKALSSIEGYGFVKEVYSINENNKEYRIEPDHLDVDNKIIADSKYYKNEISMDYKQIFYLQHIGNKYIKNDSYIQRVMEMNKWVNVLILPSSKYDHSQIIKRKTIDGLNLYTLYISINDLVNNYININSIVVTQLQSAFIRMKSENSKN